MEEQNEKFAKALNAKDQNLDEKLVEFEDRIAEDWQVGKFSKVPHQVHSIMHESLLKKFCSCSKPPFAFGRLLANDLYAN